MGDDTMGLHAIMSIAVGGGWRGLVIGSKVGTTASAAMTTACPVMGTFMCRMASLMRCRMILAV